MRTKIVLTLLSALLLVGFLVLPKNRQWFNQTIIGYWNDFLVQKDKTGVEQRKVSRWKNSYTVSKNIALFFAGDSGRSHALILIPPSAYFTERQVKYPVPEPAVFYYYTGIRTTWINSPEALKANWMVVADKGSFKLVRVRDKKALQDSIRVFKKYPVRL